MKLRRSLAVVIFVALVPLSASALTEGEIRAQVESILARVAVLRAQLEGRSATTTPISWPPLRCLTLARTLKAGMRGDDVRELQRFLMDAKLLASGNATSYFGKLTEKAVREWQSAEGIVAAGSASATGFGVVGPKTRASILFACTRPNVATAGAGAPGGQTVQAKTAGTKIVSTSRTTTATPAAARSIVITAPYKNAVITAGSDLPISWVTSGVAAHPYEYLDFQQPSVEKISAQSGVRLTLLDSSDKEVGLVATALPSSGSYSWRVPRETSDCLPGASAFDCIAQLAGCDGNASICSLTPGAYAIRAELSGLFSSSTPFSITGSATSQLFQALPGATTTQQSGYSPTTSAGGSSAPSCVYDGASFPSGATMSVACEAGHCPTSTSGYITAECRAPQWCIPFTSYCSSSIATIDVSAYEGGGASPIGSGYGYSCPLAGWRVYLECAQGACFKGWNICTASGWKLDPDQTVH